MLLTYILNPFASLIAFETPGTSRFGITFVYKLPGPNTIASASFIASITPGATLIFVGDMYILLILLTFYLPFPESYLCFQLLFHLLALHIF